MGVNVCNGINQLSNIQMLENIQKSNNQNNQLISLSNPKHLLSLQFLPNAATNVLHIYVGSSCSETDSMASSILKNTSNSKLINECKINENILSVELHPIPALFQIGEKIFVVEHFLHYFHTMCIQNKLPLKLMLKNGFFFLTRNRLSHSTQVCYYCFQTSEQKQENIDEKECLQLYAAISIEILRSSNFQTYLNAFKKIANGNYEAVEEKIVRDLLPGALSDFLIDLVRGNIPTYRMAIHYLEIAKQRYERGVKKERSLEQLKQINSFQVVFERKNTKTGLCNQLNNCSKKKKPMQFHEKRLKHSHSMTSLCSSTSKNRKYKKLSHFNKPKLKNTQKSNSFMKSNDSNWGSRVRLGRFESIKNKGSVGMLDSSPTFKNIRANQNWYKQGYQIDEFIQKREENDGRKKQNSEIKNTSIYDLWRTESQVINDQLLLSKVDNFKTTPNTDFQSTLKNFRADIAFDRNQLDKNLKKNGLKKCSHVYQVQISAPKPKKLFVCNQVFFISESGLAGENHSYLKHKREIPRSQKIPTIQKCEEEKFARTKIKNELSGKREEIHDELESVDFEKNPKTQTRFKAINSKASGKDVNISINLNKLNSQPRVEELTKKNSAPNMVDKCKNNYDFLVSVINFASKQLGKSQKPRWVVAAYIIYLHYSIKIFESGDNLELRKSLENLNSFISKNKKIKTIENLLSKGANSLLGIKVNKDNFEKVKSDSEQVLITHFQEIADLLWEEKSELINRNLFKPYMKYLMMLTLSIKIIRNIEVDVPQISQCVAYEERVDNSNELFVNVKDETKNFRELLGI